MTKEEAIKILEEGKQDEYTRYQFETCLWTAVDMAIEALRAQATLDDVATAYENGYRQGKFEAKQWIPCSERLPDKNGEYFVTVGKDSRFAFNGEATVYEDTFQFLCQWDDCGEDVIAWMKMPEPYKENET